MFAVSQKFTPSSSARLMIACERSSLTLAPCIIELASASPNVIAPRQISDTRAPLAPKDLNFMADRIADILTVMSETGASLGGRRKLEGPGGTPGGVGEFLFGILLMG